MFVYNVDLHRCGMVGAASHCTSGHHGDVLALCLGGMGWEDRNAALFLSAWLVRLMGGILRRDACRQEEGITF